MIFSHSKPASGHYGDSLGREPSLGTLLKRASRQTQQLFRQELELARVEVTESLARLGRNIALLVAGGLIIYAGILALMASGAIGLAVALSSDGGSGWAGWGTDLSTAIWIGPLIVGALACLGGVVLIQLAVGSLRRESLKPKQTVETLRETKEWLKDRMTSDHDRTYSATMHCTED